MSGSGARAGSADISDFDAAHATESIIPIMNIMEIEIAIIQFISLSPQPITIYNLLFITI